MVDILSHTCRGIGVMMLQILNQFNTCTNQSIMNVYIKGLVIRMDPRNAVSGVCKSSEQLFRSMPP